MQDTNKSALLSVIVKKGGENGRGNYRTDD